MLSKPVTLHISSRKAVVLSFLVVFTLLVGFFILVQVFVVPKAQANPDCDVADSINITGGNNLTVSGSSTLNGGATVNGGLNARSWSRSAMYHGDVDYDGDGTDLCHENGFSNVRNIGTNRPCFVQWSLQDYTDGHDAEPVEIGAEYTPGSGQIQVINHEKGCDNDNQTTIRIRVICLDAAPW